MANLKELDPVQGLVDYVLDIKPYHTKIVEVLVEYVYSEPVDVTILDEHSMDVSLMNPPGYYSQVWDDDLGGYVGVLNPGSLLSPDALFKYECHTGWDTSGFGSGQLLITSPNPSILLQNYPAINSGLNNFTINGNVTTDVKAGDVIFISSLIEDFTDLYNIFSINPGPGGTASFVVLGDVTTTFVPGYTFEMVNAGLNNGTYTVDTASTFDGTYTTIPVVQSVPLGTTGGTIGIVTAAGVHNGYFTVAGVEYNGGSIDWQFTPNDPLTVQLGNNPHSIITVVEPLAAIPALTATQSYVATVVLDPIEIETALSYSRAEKIYNAPNVSQEPNEGTNRSAILGVTLSTVVAGIPVPDSGKVVIGGDFRTSNVFVGDAIKIDSSTGNNGTYTITSIVYDGGQDETTFGVTELIDDSTVDGFGTITIPANVFFVAEDRTDQFTQGRQFDVFGGSFSRTYTILRSDYTQGKTRVRVAETIFDIGAGNTIVDTTGGFVVPGNQESTYAAGVSFNVTGSPQNDGPYVVGVGGTTFDPVTGLSTVSVDVTIDSTPGGELHVALHGSFKQHKYGFDENSPLCGMVPETIVAVYFNEKIKFTGLGLDLHDDLIAYNLENDNPGGFEFPLMTIVSGTTPAVPSQATAPVAPTFRDLWYDTTNEWLRQWNNYEWKTTKTAYWFDTTINALSYRTMDKFVDTGWVLDSFRMPGYNDFVPAVGEIELIDEQLYTAVALTPGVADTDFTLDTAVPGSDETLLEVTVNNVPAGFTLTTANDFTVTSPPVTIGDIIVAKVHDRTQYQTNAHVTPFDVQPHQVFHRTVTVDDTNDAYIVAGGNFIDRFVPFNNFTVFDTSIPSANLGVQQATSLPIIDVDDIAGTITIQNDYTWLFTANRIFRVNPSERNYNDFEVQSSTYDAGSNTTIIDVIPFPYESDNNDTDVTQQYFYNPPQSILSIDNVTDAIIVPGKVIESFPIGMQIKIENSTTGNNLIWTVGSLTYDSINDRTNIFIAGDIPDPDATGNAFVRTPIFQNYSRDLGVIIGAVFDSAPGGVGPYDTSQPKTIVLPSTAVLSADADAIEYTWVGPVRFDIASTTQTDAASATMLDNLKLADELLGGANHVDIIFTDAIANTYTIYHEELVEDLPSNPGSFIMRPVDLTDLYAPGSIFRVADSYSVTNPTSEESNDALYVVASSTFDGTNTIITIETDFDAIPPYNSFTVVEVSNNDGPPDELSTMTLLGNYVNLFNAFISSRFRLDEPLLSTDPLDNVMEVTGVELVGGNTVLTIDNDFIDESFTGPIGIIEAVYRGNIYYDETPPSIITWEDGRVIVDRTSADTLTATTFTDDLMFGWGNTLRWDIIDASEVGSSVDLLGDFTAVIFPNDPVSIVGSQNIDGGYEAVSVSYNGGTNTSTVVLANPVLPAPGTTLFGQLEMDNIDITPWFQYNILEIRSVTSDVVVDGNVTGDVSSGQEIRILGTLFNNGIVTASGAPTFDSVTQTSTIPVTEPLNPGSNPIDILVTSEIIKVHGTAAMYLQGGSVISIVNSTGNDGSYIVEGVTFDGVFSSITITTTLPDSTPDGDVEFIERGGWVESIRYQGMTLRFEDMLRAQISEVADATVLLSSGSLIDSWDYDYFDVGSFDESLGTLIHLYSNTF